jgi:hypothetical protein
MRQKRWHLDCFPKSAACLEEPTLSWNKQLSQLIVATLIVVSVPALAFAQRGGGRRGGGGGRVVVSRPVVISPFFSPFYGYGRYYDPFFMDFYGWGFPSFYAPVFYNRGYLPESSARIQVTPRHTEVYVDGVARRAHYRAVSRWS